MTKTSERAGTVAVAADAAATTTATNAPPPSSSTDEALPVFDHAPLVRLLEQQQDNPNHHRITAAELDADQDLARLCRGVADSLARTSCLLVRDPRVPPRANDAFLDALERYFARDHATKLRDCRPELHYQVGATPPHVETPRCVADPSVCESVLQTQRPGHEAVRPQKADLKWRFFWRVGARPEKTDFPELNAPQVVPEGLEQEWPALMDAWGGALLSAVEAVAVAAAHGLGLRGGSEGAEEESTSTIAAADPCALRDVMRGGPHLLAPTGSDLCPASGTTAGDVLAGFHYDLNLLTIHGKARYEGLNVWLRDGTRLAVRVPDGCLLLQAGKQLELFTGGRVVAGWHEVLATETALQMARERLGGKESGGEGWRVSSTLFAHARSDATLRPLLPFLEAGGGEEEEDEAAWRRRFAPVKAGAQVQAELEAIKLAASAKT